MLVSATTKEGHTVLINIDHIVWITDELNGYNTIQFTNQTFILVKSAEGGLSATEKLLNNLYRRF